MEVSWKCLSSSIFIGFFWNEINHPAMGYPYLRKPPYLFAWFQPLFPGPSRYGSPCGARQTTSPQDGCGPLGTIEVRCKHLQMGSKNRETIVKKSFFCPQNGWGHIISVFSTIVILIFLAVVQYFIKDWHDWCQQKLAEKKTHWDLMGQILDLN